MDQPGRQWQERQERKASRKDTKSIRRTEREENARKQEEERDRQAKNHAHPKAVKDYCSYCRKETYHNPVGGNAMYGTHDRECDICGYVKHYEHEGPVY